jgi:hydroxymethylglutaryl-CoA synthase
MLVSDDPRLIAFDGPACGNYARDEHDFWRPLYREHPLVDGPLSRQCYAEALAGAVRSFVENNDDGRRLLEDVSVFTYHTPFPKMVRAAHRSLRNVVALSWDPEHFEAMAEPGLVLPSHIGNLYTASLFVSLLSTIQNSGIEGNYRIGLFSYGSGMAGEFTTCVCRESAREAVAATIDAALTKRKRLSVGEYEDLIRERSTMDQRKAAGRVGAEFAYLGVLDHRRVYEDAPPAAKRSG